MTFDPRAYWEQRYAKGGNSGRGSRGEEATFKIDRVVATLNRTSSTTLLDFGAGDGHVAFAVKALVPGVSYFGYDLSSTAVEANNTRAGAEAHWDMNFAVADVTKIARTGFADVVLCLDVLHHLPTVEQHMRVIDLAFMSARRVAMFTAWSRPEAPKLAQHCFFHEFPRERVGWDLHFEQVPQDPVKLLVTATRRGAL